jgi:hypothetical protein
MARYQDAIAWMAMNDDTEWVENHPDKPSVTAVMIADLWDRDVEEVTADLRRKLKSRDVQRAKMAHVIKDKFPIKGS